MKPLNKLRMSAGMKIDPSIEITEARTVPKRKTELTPRDEKVMKVRVEGVEKAIKCIKSAIESLDNLPSTDFNGIIPHHISELEDILTAEDGQGMEHYLGQITTEMRKFKRSENSKKRAEEEEEIRLLAMNEEEAIPDETVSESDKVDESVHNYSDNYKSFEKDETKPINVSNGTSNDEQYYPTNKSKSETPSQLKSMDQQDNSPQDKTGNDLSNEMKIPKNILNALRNEMKAAELESEKQDVYNKEEMNFQKDLARMFKDLLGHLEKQTIYDFKLAQNFAQSLMGPMLHKLPTDVWKFLANAGETKSLKSYMQEIPKDLQYPRNKTK